MYERKSKDSTLTEIPYWKMLSTINIPPENPYKTWTYCSEWHYVYYVTNVRSLVNGDFLFGWWTNQCWVTDMWNTVDIFQLVHIAVTIATLTRSLLTNELPAKCTALALWLALTLKNGQSGEEEREKLGHVSVFADISQDTGQGLKNGTVPAKTGCTVTLV